MKAQHCLLAIAICSSSLFAQEDSPKSDDKKPATPLIEFRKAWQEKGEGRVASDFKLRDRDLYLEPKAQITELDVKSVKLVPSKYYEYDLISLELTEEGAEKMRTLSKEHLKKPLAILVRGKVVMAPTIQDQLSNRIEVSGVESKKEAQTLVTEIQKQIDERD
jgi:preprotein translocase subunit SecD